MPQLKRQKTKYPGVFFVTGTSVKNKPEKVYYIRYRKDGKLIEEKAGRQYQDNMTPAKASHLRSKRIEGDQLSNKERRDIEKEKLGDNGHISTYDQLFALFLEHKSHLKSLKDDRIRYNLHLRNVIGEKEFAEVSPFDIDRIRISLLKSHKPATVKQVLVLFKRIVNFGVRKNLCPPLAFQVDMPKVNNIKTEDLTTEQLSSLIKAINEDPDYMAANIMRLALYTGMRKGEIFRLQWQDIDLEKGYITVRDPKGGTDQVIPMNSGAREVLVNHPHSDSPYLFPGKTGGHIKDCRVSINRIKKRAGLPDDFRPLHGLRHVYASMLASSGKVDMYTLQKLLTHKTPQMTQRYAHLRDEALKRAADVVDDIIGGIVTQGDKVE